VYFGTLDTDASAAESFEAKSGDMVTITVRRFSLDFDPVVTLLSPDGTVLAENDDHDDAVFAASDYDAQIVNFSLPADGIYPVAINGSDGSGGSFILTIDVQR
ncbi:MAG: hypothetical protein ABI700_33600, partial [Chloroflexota bacterium]